MDYCKLLLVRFIEKIRNKMQSKRTEKYTVWCERGKLKTVDEEGPFVKEISVSMEKRSPSSGTSGYRLNAF